MHESARDVTFFDWRIQVGFVAANDAIDEILEVCILSASLDRRLLLLIPVLWLPAKGPNFAWPVDFLGSGVPSVGVPICAS